MDYNKLPRSKYIRLVNLMVRLESVTKDFRLLCDNNFPCYLVTHKLEQSCDLIKDAVDYAKAKV